MDSGWDIIFHRPEIYTLPLSIISGAILTPIIIPLTQIIFVIKSSLLDKCKRVNLLSPCKLTASYLVVAYHQ